MKTIKHPENDIAQRSQLLQTFLQNKGGDRSFFLGIISALLLAFLLFFLFNRQYHSTRSFPVNLFTNDTIPDKHLSSHELMYKAKAMINIKGLRIHKGQSIILKIPGDTGVLISGQIQDIRSPNGKEPSYLGFQFTSQIVISQRLQHFFEVRSQAEVMVFSDPVSLWQIILK